MGRSRRVGEFRYLFACHGQGRLWAGGSSRAGGVVCSSLRERSIPEALELAYYVLLQPALIGHVVLLALLLLLAWLARIAGLFLGANAL